MPNGPAEYSMLIPSSDLDQVVMYHGTPRYFEGPPTVGHKDVLRTGTLSLTSNPYVAEFFAGGARDSKIWSLEMPRDRILDLTNKSDKRLPKEIEKAKRSGEYDAVAIRDITFGDEDQVEFRLLNPPSPEDWHVGPTVEHVDTYTDFNKSVESFKKGWELSESERLEAIEFLKDEIEHGNASQEMINILEELKDEGRGTQEVVDLARERARQNDVLLRALEANDPHLLRMDDLRGAVERAPAQDRIHISDVLALTRSGAPEHERDMPAYNYGSALEYRSLVPRARSSQNRGRGRLGR